MALMAATLAMLAALLIAGAVLTAMMSLVRARRRALACPPLGRLLTVSGQRLHVLQAGPTDGPQVVLLHGASGNLRDLQISLLPGLVRAGYRVTLFDRPGLGHSLPCAAGMTLRRQVEILDDACTALGLERFVLCGQSFGGAAAACWAVHRPAKLSALVLIAAPVFPWPPQIKRHFRLMARPMTGGIIAWLLSAWMPLRRLQDELTPQFAPDPVPPDYMRRAGSVLSLRPASLRADALQRLRLVEDQREMVDKLPALRLPVEIVQGMQDTTVKPERHAEPLRKEVPGARLKRLKGAGHMPHHAHAEACLQAIDRATRRAAPAHPTPSPPRANPVLSRAAGR